MDENTFDNDLRRLSDLAVRIDALDADRKQLSDEYEELSWKLAQYMEQTGTNSKKLDGINFIKAQRAFAKIEDKVVLMDWIQANAAYDLLMAVNASKVNGYCKECIANGTEIPPGVNPNYIKHYVQIRRS